MKQAHSLSSITSSDSSSDSSSSSSSSSNGVDAGLPDQGLVPVYATYDELKEEFLQNMTEADKQLLVPEESRIQVTWTDIVYEVPDRSKKQTFLQKCKREKVPRRTLIHGVSGYCSPGSMMAIIGPSGAGKTSLLNILAKRLKNEKGVSKITGSIKFNGHECTSSEMGVFTGFVSQEDIVMGSMTPLEVLRFTAALTLPASVSQEEKDARVDLLLMTMGLDKCKDNFIGSAGTGAQNSGIKRGLSGGERKRVSICIELVNNPTLLFCDEPTSGLDSFASKIVCERLQKLAFLGQTIIATIHQPSSEIFRLFNRLAILADGKTVFFGDRSQATAYFSKLGYLCPKFINPADYLMKVVQVNPAAIEGGEDMEDADSTAIPVSQSENNDVGLRNATREQVDKLKEAYLSSDLYRDATNPPPPPSTNIQTGRDDYVVGYWTQFIWLLRRSWMNTLREPALLKAKIAVSMFMGIFVGLVFLRTEDNAAGAADRTAAAFFILSNQMFGGMSGPTYLFPAERGVYFRDRNSNMYATVPYYLAKLLSEMPVACLAPLEMGCIAWWLIGFNNNVQNFFQYCLILILMLQVAYGLGMVLSTSILDPSLVNRVQPLFTLPLMIFAGFFVNLDSVGKWLSWIQYINPVKYAFRFGLHAALSGTVYTCRYDEWREVVPIAVPLLSNDTAQVLGRVEESSYLCPVSTGDAYLLRMGVTGDNYGLDILYVSLFAIGFHIFACSVLYFRKPQLV
eukprot:TRINITY_DN1079_c0_g2_i1.p1 TRINITY_DN1079_c0_g2~~TRINITY_DN1079_c0_g2_i1.p1  ORF type:complete len:738 (-),score=164.67 TRINITY_DN1079_c0_g2_i1:110-2323(-)